MRTLLWFAYFWISLVCLTPSMLYTYWLDRAGRTEQRNTIVHREVYRWMFALLRLAKVQVEVDGLENIPNAPVVFVSNHQGNFDIPILLCHLDRPHGVLAKKQLARFPFIRVWMRYLGCVFIDRENPRQSVESLGKAAQNVRDGYSMIVFPEGTRSRGKPIGEFKPGAFRIASKTGAPIVPVCIEGSFQAMEAHGFWIHPAKVRLSLLPPIHTSSLSKEECKQLPTLLQSLITARREELCSQGSGA